MTPQAISVAASKPKKPQPIKARTEITPALVLLGRGSDGKPHAAAFPAEDAELARKAASLMAMRAVEITGEFRELAKALPKGRVFGSGRAFAPFVAAKTYAALLTAAGLEDIQPVASQSAEASAETQTIYALPKGWGDLKAGCLALASEGAGHAWFEVIVVEDRGDDVFVVRWRDSPDLEPFPRHRDHLGLLPAGYVQPGEQRQ